MKRAEPQGVGGWGGTRDLLRLRKQHNCFAIQSGVILHIIYGYFIQPPDCQDVFNFAQLCDHDITERERERERERGTVWASRSSKRAIISPNSKAPPPPPPLSLLALSGTNNSTVAEALKKQSAEYPRVMSVVG